MSAAPSPFKPYPSTRGPAKIFLYGDPGTEKTRRAMAMPKPLAIIDMEGGACDYQDLAKDGDLYLATRSVAELEKALAWVEANADKVGTLIVDPITVVWQQLQQGHVARTLKRGTIRRNGQNIAVTEPEEVTFEIGDWSKLKTHHGAILTRLLNLPCHVVMIARGMDKTDEKGNVKGYGWDGEKNLAFLAKIVIETRAKGDVVIKDRFTNQFADGAKTKRVDLRVFVNAAGKAGVQLDREDDAAAKDAGAAALEPSPEPQAPAARPSQPAGDRAELSRLLLELARKRGAAVKDEDEVDTLERAMVQNRVEKLTDAKLAEVLPKFRAPSEVLLGWFDGKLRSSGLIRENPGTPRQSS